MKKSTNLTRLIDLGNIYRIRKLIIPHLLRPLAKRNIPLTTDDRKLYGLRDKHKGERCFILGMGPSLNKTDITLLNNEYTFGVNGIYMVENFIPVYYVMISADFWKTHVEGVKNVRCERRFIPADTIGELDSDVPTSWINFQRPIRSFGGISTPRPLYFSKKPHRVIQGGGTVIFVCLQLAYYMGFKQAIILGVDCNGNRVHVCRWAVENLICLCELVYLARFETVIRI